MDIPMMVLYTIGFESQAPKLPQFQKTLKNAQLPPYHIYGTFIPSPQLKYKKVTKLSS